MHISEFFPGNFYCCAIPCVSWCSFQETKCMLKTMFSNFCFELSLWLAVLNEHRFDWLMMPSSQHLLILTSLNLDSSNYFKSQCSGKNSQTNLTRLNTEWLDLDCPGLPWQDLEIKPRLTSSWQRIWGY